MHRILILSSCLIIVSSVMGGCTLKDMEDTVFHCGESQKNCTVQDRYWVKGDCISGDCIVSECLVGAHKVDGKCEHDTVETCGEPPRNCYEKGEKCSEGVCVSNCQSPKVDCNGSCENLDNDHDNCGECGHKCGSDESCENSVCHKSRLEPECVSKGTCVCKKNSDTDCEPECAEGYDGDLCNKCADGYQLNRETSNCHRIPVSDIGQCDTGYTGENCDECDLGWHSNDDICEIDSIEHCGEGGQVCSFEHGIPKCEAGQCVLERCDEGYIQEGAICVLSNTETPDCTQNSDCAIDNGTGTCNTDNQCEYTCEEGYILDKTNCVLSVTEPSECTQNSDCSIDNGVGTCNTDKECEYVCNPGFTLDGSDCVKSTTNPPVDPECTQDSECTIDHGKGTCNSDGECSYQCNIGYSYNETIGLCEELQLIVDCSNDSECNKVENATGTCFKGICNYTCFTDYHKNNDKDKCIPDTPTECGESKSNCVDNCVKSAEDPSRSIGSCTSGSCSCGECKGVYVANSDHTKCVKGEPTLICDPAFCVSNHEGWKKATCENDKCVVTECADNYHLYKETTDTTSEFYNIAVCEEDTVEHCGSHETNCTKKLGWKDGNCSDGTCKATECKDNYKLVGDNCQKNLTPTCSIDYKFDCNMDGTKCCKRISDCDDPYSLDCRLLID